jgi:UDP-glucuronate decarboxylase
MVAPQSNNGSRLRQTIIHQDLTTILQADLPWNQLSGKTVLITGAAGLLASYLVRTLLFLNQSDRLSQPVRILGLVRNRAKAKTQLLDIADDPNLHFIQADVSEPFAWDENFQTPDLIIHAASPASPLWYMQDPLGTIHANTEGMQRMLALAQKMQVQSVLYLSTSEIYGDTSSFQDPLRESDMGALDPMSLRSCYAESKRLGETLCKAWHEQYGIPVKVARPFHTFGPGLRLDDGRVFADFIGNVLRGEDIVLKSAGTAQRAFCYLSDATVGFFTILLKGKSGQAYNVGNPNNLVSMLDLANQLSSFYPERQIGVRREFDSISETVASPVAISCPDISKLNALGWSPHVSLEESFRRTIESMSSPQMLADCVR